MGLIDYGAYRKVIEQLYEDTCTIEHYKLKGKDPVSRVTTGAWETIAQDQPCYVDIKAHAAADATDTVAQVSQAVTIILAPEIDIPEGSRITATKKGVTRAYKASGLPRVEGSHQEIVLVLEDHG